MKKQDIRDAYTAKLTELLNQGYTIFPDTMGGSQGEIAHTDLRKGSEIYRLLLDRNLAWCLIDEDFHGDMVTLTFGKAAADTRVSDHWDGTIWNNRLEPIFQIEWAEVSPRGEGWYTDTHEAVRIGHLRMERYRNRNDRAHRTDLSEAYKSAALRWLRKQPKMKTCRMEDIEKIERVTTPKGKRYFEIRAKGKTYTIG